MDWEKIKARIEHNKTKGHFAMGFAKALDISGTKEWPDISDDKRKDFLALRGDWEVVGDLIRRRIH